MWMSCRSRKGDPEHGEKKKKEKKKSGASHGLGCSYNFLDRPHDSIFTAMFTISIKKES